MSEAIFDNGAAMIFGGSGGVGQGVCREFAKAGTDVAITYHRNKDGADALAAELRGLGVKASAHQVTIGDAARVEAAIDEVAKEYGRIHSIVASNDLAAAIVAQAAGLSALGATATVRDTAAHVVAVLDGLEPLSGTLVTSIIFTDAPQILTLTVSWLAADGGALALIGSSYGITVSDTAAHIQADLALGHPTLVANLATVSSIVASDGGGVTLTEARAVAGGVADGVIATRSPSPRA